MTGIYSEGQSTEPATVELLRRRRRALGSPYKLFYDQPLRAARALGTRIWDADGKEYLDAYNNVPVVGHGNPRVVDAVARQASTLNAHTRYLDDAVVDYAERLLATLPPTSDYRVIFTCSGSEANDLALRVVRAATDRRGVLVTENAYHGVTSEVSGISPSLVGRDGVHPHVAVITAPGRGRDLAEAVDEGVGLLRSRGFAPGALIFDSVFSSDGVHTDVPSLVLAVEHARAAGALIVADEVQAGFARVGEPFWGFIHHGIEPDLIVLGKPMGNGYPVAALVGRSDLIDAFAERSRYFNTFGGTTVAVAAARATLDVIQSEGLAERAQVLGQQLRDPIRSMSGVVDVRGAGLFLGVELAGDERAARVVNELRRRGVLLSATGPALDTLKIRPPLIFDENDLDLLLTQLAETLKETA